MLPFVPYLFDLYRDIRPHLRLTMLHVVGHAGFTGGCCASVRTLAAQVGRTKSTVSRHLAELVAAGYLRRHRKPGGCYAYTVDSRFLPSVSRESVEVSRRREPTVPPVRTYRKSPTEIREGDSLPSTPWDQRVQSFRESRFWLPAWGPRPTEPGCLAPISVVRAILGG